MMLPSKTDKVFLMTRFCLLCLLINSTYFYSIAQVTNLPLTSPLRFTNFTIADGLPSNNINHLMQDSRGFIWFSTSQGLARFDGSHFVVYGHSSKDSSSMPFDFVPKSIELNSHELLFVSGTKLWMLNPINGRQHPPPVFWQKKGVVNLFLLNKNLLAVTNDKKTYIANSNLDIIDSIRNPLPANYQVIYLGDNNILFENSHRAISFSLTDKKMMEWKLDNISNQPNPQYYFDDVDTLNKHIYLRGGGYQAAKVSYRSGDSEYLKIKPIKHAVQGLDGIVFYKNGISIIPIGQQLCILQPAKPEMLIQNIPGNTSCILPFPQHHIYTDNMGNYWSAGEGGISRFTMQQINYQYWKLPYPSSINHFSKYDNKIWMTDEVYGSCYVDCVTQTFHVLDSSILQYCWGAVPVSNQIYIHGNITNPVNRFYPSKLIIYNPQTKKLTNSIFLDSFTKNKELVTLVYQARNGDVWYSINGGGGLVRQQPGTNTFTQYSESNNTPGFHFRYVNKAAEDNNGNIYFSVNKRSNILVWKNIAQHFEEWNMDSILSIKDIHFGPLLCHIIDRNQNLWLSYEQGGLLKYNLATRMAKLYAREDGLPTNVFDNMTTDADANIWIPSPRGLYCLLSGTDKFIRFTDSDGLPFTDFSNSKLFFDGADSSLYFSSIGYLYKLNISALLTRKKQSIVKLFIDGLDVNNRPFYFTGNKKILLGPDENNLQFSFVLLDLDNKTSGKNYEYLLKRNKENTNWQSLQGTNTIAFSRLKPGDYTLMVRIKDESGSGYIYGSNIISFTIATAWYNSIWFICLSIIAGGLITGAFIRLYYQRKLIQQKALLDKQKALEDERARIAADMHDDMGAGLSRMRYLSVSMKNEIRDEDLKKGFDKMIMGSDELVDKMNEIIWTLNSGNENLDEVLYYIRSQCSEMLDNANIDFACNMPVSIPDKKVSSEEKRNLYLVVKEAVHNAIKHSGAGLVTLEVQTRRQLTIIIADNGSGFNSGENILKGNGLSNYKKRMEVLRGTVDVQSGKKGTVITFELPLL
jgi:signal transduction histidine kinase